MINTRKVKLVLVSFLAIMTVFMSFSRGILAMPDDPFSKIQEKLSGISDEEKKVLQDLFSLEQEIAGMENEENSLNKDIDSLNGEINTLKKSISDDENSYNQRRDVLKQVLQIYQKNGPGSYLEIILDSKDLNSFLWRISTLQDLSRNTGELLKSLEQSKDKLSQKKDELSQKLLSMEDKQKELKGSIDKKQKLKEEEENYLTSLKEQRGSYEEQLSSLEQAWGEVKLLFADIEEEFSKMIKSGSLPPDAVKVTLTMNGVEGTIDEKTFNNIISVNPTLSQMSFSFHPGSVEISMPKTELVLKGKFEVADESVIKFVPEEGSFYGMPLEIETMNELFKEGGLTLELKQFIGNNSLDSVEAMEGRLNFIVKIAFPFH